MFVDCQIDYCITMQEDHVLFDIYLWVREFMGKGISRNSRTLIPTRTMMIPKYCIGLKIEVYRKQTLNDKHMHLIN